jgi:AcrR family transcriptional regulator
MSLRTRERILAGAAAAVARHGLRKVDMRDVSAASGVSRPTVYRYFASRDALLAQLAHFESVRFQQRMLEAVAQVPSGPERVLLVLQHATEHVREHPALQRILETDPGVVLQGLRRELPKVKGELAKVLAAPLADTELVRRRVVTTDQLIDWLVRLMVSAFLLPEPPPSQMAEGLTAVYKILSSELRHPVPNRRPRRPRRKS